MGSFGVEKKINHGLKISMGIIACLMFSTSIFSQSFESVSKPGIGLTFIGNLPEKIEITQNYTPDPDSTDLTAMNIVGYEIRLHYTQPIPVFPSFKLRFGVMVGVNPYKYNTKLISPYHDSTTGGFKVLSAPIYGYEMYYSGLSIGGLYSILKSKRMNLMVGVNISYVYFPSGLSLFGVTALDDNNNQKKLFKSALDINPEDKRIFCPDFGLTYSQKIGKRFNLEATIMGLWSKGYIMKSYTDYQILGDRDTLTGTFQQKFSYIGFSVGISYDFKKVTHALH